LQDSQGLRPYKTILSAGESEIDVSKSRFLGFCLPASSEAQAQELLAGIRKKHHEARHCCYAYRLTDGGIVRSSDDGEPSGTAGAPILSVLMGAEVENVLCAVVRYFGGVLLGTGGLVRAYGKAASEALGAARIVGMRLCRRLRVTIPYSYFNALESLLHAKAYPFETEFAENIALFIRIPDEEAESFTSSVSNRTDGKARIENIGRSVEALSLDNGRNQEK
jgi:uncharacterized YigZ family protein